MKPALRLGLRSGEKVYINGAVLRVDRRVCIELLNDATFLLESHVMSPDQATDALRRLYFLVQGLLIDPSVVDSVRPAAAASVELIIREGVDCATSKRLREAAELLDEGAYFAALKVVRGLIGSLKPIQEFDRETCENANEIGEVR